jgi:hypothetical protein
MPPVRNRQLLSASDVATAVGIQPRSVLRVAQRIQVGEKVGGTWVFSFADMKAISQAKYSSPGNPNFSRKAIDR